MSKNLERYGLISIELSEGVPRMDWAVDNLIPRRHLSTIYGPAGVGKTSFISALAVQHTNPHGGHFLGQAVAPGRVVIIDADDQTGYGYQAWLNRFAASTPDADLTRIDVKGLNRSMTAAALDALENDLKTDPPALIIVDTFASAFHDVDVLKGHKVQDQLLRLAAMAKNLNCAVVTLDHVAKLQRGETVAGRGPYGAAKTFAPRAIFALSKVDTKDHDGPPVIRVECTKQSYALLPEPMGIIIELSRDGNRASIRNAVLPDESATAATGRLFKRLLMAATGEPIPRQELLTQAVEVLDISDRYAAHALALFLDTAAANIETHTLPGRGSPKAYTWKES